MLRTYIFVSIISSMNCALLTEIDNFIMIGNADAIFVNKTRNECICKMINSNSSIAALNYYPNNQTCQLFSSRITSIYVQLNPNATLLYLNQSNLTVQIGEYSSKRSYFVYSFALFLSSKNNHTTSNVSFCCLETKCNNSCWIA